MRLFSPDKHAFIRKLRERGTEKVQEDLHHERYGPPYDDLARKWLEQTEKSRADQTNTKSLRLVRWQIVLAILAIITTILIYLLSQYSGR